MVDRTDSATISDHELVAALTSGQGDALDELYRRYAKKLHVFFSATLGVRDPEDLVHDTFLRVIDAAHQFDPERAPFRAWLFRIARNLATDRLRRQRRVRFESIADESRSPDVADSAPDPSTGALHDELCAAVRACLAELGDEERQAFVLYHLADQVLREIGDAFGKSISTVRNWITAAADKVRRCLTRKGVEP